MKLRALYLIKVAESLSNKYGEMEFNVHVKKLYEGMGRLFGKGTFSRKDFIEWLDINPILKDINLINLYYEYFADPKNTILKGGLNSNNDLIISMNPLSLEEEKADERLKQSHILKGVGKIPTLYMYIIEEPDYYTRQYTMPLIDTEMAHNYFIVEALSHRFYMNMNDKNNVRTMKKFIEQNAGKINEIRRLFSGQPKRLGSGADGTAFAINETMVLKIFSSKFAYESAISAIETLHKESPMATTEAMIYDAGIIGKFNGESIYYYIIEKMTPVRKIDYNLMYAIEKIAYKVEELVYRARATNMPDITWSNDPKEQEEIKKFIDENVQDITNNIVMGKSHDDVEYIKSSGILATNWLEKFIEEIFYKTITQRTDLHMGNAGITNNGYVRFFDPAFRSDF